MTRFQISNDQAEKFRKQRIEYWDLIAENKRLHGLGSGSYHRRLKEIYRFHIPPGMKVIEIGCGEGDLLASVQPGYGVGIDFSGEMVKRAHERHPGLHFIEADGLELALSETFDAIILSDLVNDVWDVQVLFQGLHRLCHPGTRIILNFFSRLWTPILVAAEAFGLAQRPLAQSWLTAEDIGNLMNLAGLEQLISRSEILFPLPVPLVEPFCNKFLVRIWPFNLLALTNLIIARPRQFCRPGDEEEQYSVSVVIPARNESGNIQQIFERVPDMGRSTELVFVEGNSKDDTFEEINRQISLHPNVDARLLKQTGKGKGDAVRLGFQTAKGEILMILDSDLSVPPEYLPRFYEALVNRTGEFANGVRLVYPMERQAMRLVNFLGNKFFSLAFRYLLGQAVKDTLCGTKALNQSDYQRIAANRAYFGDFDPFGDFDLLFGASKLNLKIVDIPIRYQERTYGSTNIQRWRHGWLLIKMVVFAAFRMKFK